VGREVVRVAVLSRNPPASGAFGNIGGAEYFRADVTTGEGVAAALAGADVVIDCLEGRAGKARKKFADGGARLLAAAHDAGTGRAVMLSIVNCDRSNSAFYRSKAAKENSYELPGAMGRYLREGLNLVPEARHGTETFRGWLENSADSL
jgi:hypothetical protein